MRLNTTRSYYDTVYRVEHKWRYAEDDKDRIDKVLEVTRHWLTRAAVPVSGIVCDVGSGTGAFAAVHPGWVGLDISATACIRAGLSSGRPTCVMDATALPLRTGSVDAVMTWATLEHVPEPDRALDELARVLKPGGVAILAPAWHCRSWTVKRLPFKSYRELSWKERLEKATIPIRETILWRGAAAAPVRIWREFSMRFAPLAFPYKRLTPDLNADLPHVADDDAACEIDPHSMITALLSRGWTILSHPTLLKRLLSRSGAVVALKPS